MATMTSTTTTSILPRTTMSPAYSPLSSAGSTPSTASPASPRHAHSALLNSSQILAQQQQPHPATRQIRPPKSPLYVPAALRPTERPNKAHCKDPFTPPHSQHPSSDSLVTAHHHKRNTSLTGTTPRPHTPSPPSISTNISTLTRSYSTASSSIFTNTAPPSPSTSTSAFPPPTRAHWKPDGLAVRCDAPACALVFSLLARRHHCRRCGGVFCASHSACQVPLDEDAGFDDKGGWYRACDNCADLWADRVGQILAKVAEAVHLEGRAGGENGEGEDEQDGQARGGGAIPIGGKKAGAAGEDGEDGEAKKAVAAASVPKDWSWSTF